jgi:hypothetical protein
MDRRPTLLLVSRVGVRVRGHVARPHGSDMEGIRADATGPALRWRLSSLLRTRF